MADNENTFLNADNIYMDVEGEAGKSLDLELEQQTNLVGIIKDRYYSAEDKRNLDEARWLKAYENYRGLYNKSVKFRDSEKSRIFVKITKTKVLAAFGQLVDVIFGTGKFPSHDHHQVWMFLIRVADYLHLNELDLIHLQVF